MADIEDLHLLVRSHVKGAPKAAMTDALLRVAREFCVKSRYVRRTILIDLETGISEYVVDLDDDQVELCGIYSAQIDARPLGQATPELIPTDLIGDPLVFNYLMPDKIKLFPASNVDKEDALSVRAVIQPRLTASTVPDELVVEFDKTIADGALAYFYTMPWLFDAAMASYYEKKFNDGIDTARAQADRAFNTMGFRTLSAW